VLAESSPQRGFSTTGCMPTPARHCGGARATSPSPPVCWAGESRAAEDRTSLGQDSPNPRLPEGVNPNEVSRWASGSDTPTGDTTGRLGERNGVVVWRFGSQDHRCPASGHRSGVTGPNRVQPDPRNPAIAGLDAAAQHSRGLHGRAPDGSSPPSDTSHMSTNTGQITLSGSELGAPMVPRSGHTTTKPHCFARCPLGNGSPLGMVEKRRSVPERRLVRSQRRVALARSKRLLSRSHFWVSTLTTSQIQWRSSDAFLLAEISPSPPTSSCPERDGSAIETCPPPEVARSSPRRMRYQALRPVRETAAPITRYADLRPRARSRWSLAESSMTATRSSRSIPAEEGLS
jgi:hypothetical protein